MFFYGTLMTPFNRTGRLRLDQHLSFKGRGTIRAALFDLGIYPAAVPSGRQPRDWRSVRAHRACAALRALDELEGYRPSDPETSLYTRTRTPVAMEDGTTVEAWTYFYNAPLGRAERIESGDYLEHLKVR